MCILNSIERLLVSKFNIKLFNEIKFDMCKIIVFGKYII